jgi:hypothetical protein
MSGLLRPPWAPSPPFAPGTSARPTGSHMTGSIHYFPVHPQDPVTFLSQSCHFRNGLMPQSRIWPVLSQRETLAADCDSGFRATLRVERSVPDSDLFSLIAARCSMSDGRAAHD